MNSTSCSVSAASASICLGELPGALTQRPRDQLGPEPTTSTCVRQYVRGSENHHPANHYKSWERKDMKEDIITISNVCFA